MKRIRSLTLILILTQVTCLGLKKCCAQPVPEYELKAVWLYHFGNSMYQWQEESGEDNEPFVIAVYGEYPPTFETQLARVQRLKIQGRRIIVRQSTRIQDLQQAQPDILFVTRGNRFINRVDDAKDAFEDESVLIVGDSDDRSDQIPVSFSVEPGTRQLKIWRNDSALRETGVRIHNPSTWERLSNVERVRTQDTSTPP